MTALAVVRDASLAPLVPGLPLLGSALDANADPCRFFGRCWQEHGPVFRVAYPGQLLTMIAGLEANRLFAVEGTRLFDSAATYRRVTREMGTHRIPNCHDGQAHRDHRQLLAPSLSAQALDPVLPRIFRMVRERASTWKPDAVRTVSAAVGPLVADAVSICATGLPLGDRIARDTVRYGTMMGVVGVGGAFPEWTLYTPPVRASRRRFAAFVADALADHRARPAGVDRPPDLLDALLVAQARDPSLDDTALVALGMLPSKNAGIYLYRLVSFALFELLRRPELRAAVRVEIDPTFVADGLPDVEQLKRMGTLQNTLLEALRLYPMALALPRVVREAFEFGGYRFEPGTTVYIAGPATHFSDEYFAEPDEFDPDRFSPGRSEHRRAHVYAPWGFGAHACMARGWALTLASAVLAGLLHTVRVALHPAGSTIVVRAFPNPIPEARFSIRVQEQRAAPLHREHTLSPQLSAPALTLALSPDQQHDAFGQLEEVTFPAGHVVFRQGDRPDRFWLVRRGVVEVVLETTPPTPVARLGPGSHFGEIGLLHGVPRTATVRVSADGEARLASLGAESFQLLAVECDLTRGEMVRVMEQRLLVNQLAQLVPSLDLGALGRAMGDHEVLHLGPGAVVVRQGEPADRFFLLASGELELVHEGRGGDVVIGRLQAVDVFGEDGVLEGVPRTFTVRVPEGGGVRLLALGPAALSLALADAHGKREGLLGAASARLAALARGLGV